ncbi:MAG: nucleoside-triphosphatase [Promethearchaeota archaeon]
MTHKRKIRIFITGKPRVGKTTLLIKLFKQFGSIFQCSGFITREIREKGKRVGFEAINLTSKRTAILSHIHSSSNSRVGKYGVEVESFTGFLEDLSQEKGAIEWVFLDEIAPMEFKCPNFKNLLPQLLANNFIATIHRRLAKSYTQRIPQAELFVLTESNREEIFQMLVKKLNSWKND